MSARVLVVDDEDMLRGVIRSVLEDDGYEVFEAPDGKPALAQLAGSQQGMVVLLDLQMPGMDGFSMLRALAGDEQLAARHAFIVMTALDLRTFSTDVVKLLLHLDAPLLEKPFDIDALLKTVREAEQRLMPLPYPNALDA
jgi:CheY-like chemotaxis protein